MLATTYSNSQKDQSFENIPMRLFLLLICLFLSGIFSSCWQEHNNQSGFIRQTQSVLDTSNIAVIAFDQSDDWPFKNSYQPTTLSMGEILLIDSVFKKCVLIYNENLPTNQKSTINIDFAKYKYKRQYIAVLNDKGQKEVWVNGFCNSGNTQWKTEILLVDDGGNCYFNLKINLVTKECFEVMVNGYS